MWLIIGSGVGALLMVFVLFFIVPMLVHKAIGPKLDERISRVYKADQILLKDVKAMSLGLESRGVTQGRGNGGLVVTNDTLHWFQFVPESSDVVIPRSAITGVSVARSHLGKSINRDLLHVKFTYNGKPDAMAWYVTDLQAWLSQLKEPKSAGVLE